MKRCEKTTIVLALVLFVTLAAAAPVFAAGDPAQTAQPPNPTPYAVGWGTLTLINAGIAQGKNRRGLNWFLISLILGPVATFLLVALFPKLPERVRA